MGRKTNASAARRNAKRRRARRNEIPRPPLPLPHPCFLQTERGLLEAMVRTHQQYSQDKITDLQAPFTSRWQSSTSTSSGSSPPPTSVWKEYKNQDGRSYWFHPIEKRSVWEKPDELKTPRERAIASTKWKEYKSGDRTYYVHSQTKETTWNIPPELQGEWVRPCHIARLACI